MPCLVGDLSPAFCNARSPCCLLGFIHQEDHTVVLPSLGSSQLLRALWGQLHLRALVAWFRSSQAQGFSRSCFQRQSWLPPGVGRPCAAPRRAPPRAESARQAPAASFPPAAPISPAAPCAWRPGLGPSPAGCISAHNSNHTINTALIKIACGTHCSSDLEWEISTWCAGRQHA